MGLPTNSALRFHFQSFNLYVQINKGREIDRHPLIIISAVQGLDYFFTVVVIIIRYETAATTRWALLFIVRAFFNDPITVAVWTGFHDKLIGLTLIGCDGDARLLLLRDMWNAGAAPAATSLGGDDLHLLWALCEDDTLHLFGVDAKTRLLHSRQTISGASTKAWMPLGDDVCGFSVAMAQGHAQVLAVSSNRSLSSLSFPLNSTTAIKEPRWYPCGTMYEPDFEQLKRNFLANPARLNQAL